MLHTRSGNYIFILKSSGESWNMCEERIVEYEIIYRNKEMKVTLEFPEKTDGKAERELGDRLKELYLRRAGHE